MTFSIRITVDVNFFFFFFLFVVKEIKVYRKPSKSFVSLIATSVCFIFECLLGMRYSDLIYYVYLWKVTHDVYSPLCN